MTTKIVSLILAMALGAGSSLVLAEGGAAAPRPESAAGMGAQEKPGKRPHTGKRMLREKPESFVEESTRTMADGRVFKRRVEQKVGEGSFSRLEVMTDPQGKTATRATAATYNKDKQTWTRKVEGKTADGETWSRTREVAAPHMGDDDEAGETAGQPAARKPGR